MRALGQFKNTPAYAGEENPASLLLAAVFEDKDGFSSWGSLEKLGQRHSVEELDVYEP